jgi:hypothetical protein
VGDGRGHCLPGKYPTHTAHAQSRTRGRALWTNPNGAAVVGAVQFVLTLASLVACGFSDPGIIPRGRPRSLTPQRASLLRTPPIFFFVSSSSSLYIITTSAYHV